MLTLRPGLLWLLDLLMGAFAVLVAMGLRLLACIGRTDHGLGVSLAVVRAALLCFGAMRGSACSAFTHAFCGIGLGGGVAPIWDHARVSLRRASD